MDKRRYASVESTTAFNFQTLVGKVKTSLRDKFPDTRGDKFRDLMYKSLKTFKLNGQIFDYDYSKNHFGGEKWYVKCPKCNAPCQKLFLPSKLKDREQQYLCKKCHKLKNVSLMLGNSRRYKKVVKPLKQLDKLRSRLTAINMTPEKAAPLLSEYEKIERELNSSPEYRLYRFQKEHGEL